MIPSPFQSEAHRPEPFQLRTLGAIALVASLLFSCTFAFLIAKGIIQLLYLVSQPRDTEQIFPSLLEILVFLLAVGIGSGSGGFIAGGIQALILQNKPSWRWIIASVVAWCCAVPSVALLGFPFALIFGHISPPLTMIGLAVLGGCAGGCVAWFQLRTVRHTSLSRYLWIILSMVVWASGYALILMEPAVLF